MGLNNTFKDAKFVYSDRINLDLSTIEKKLVFIFNSKKLEIKNDKTLEKIGFGACPRVIVLDVNNIIIA